MRKRVVITAAVVVSLALTGGAIAVAAKETHFPIGNLEMIIDSSSGVSPKALSKSKYTPIKFTAAGHIRTRDGSQVPPLEEILLDSKNIAVDVKGYPVCKRGQRDARDPSAVDAACKDAIIGKGKIIVSVAFPEQKPIPATSPLLVFNGGTHGGTTTFYIHAYLTQPITTAIVMTVKLRKSNGGLETVTTIPKIANGAGSVTDFSLSIDKKFTYKGKKVSVLSAKCVGGKIQAHVTARFYDNSKLSADVLRTCTPKP